MKKLIFILFVAVLIATSPAEAGDVSLSWIAPTQNVDATPYIDPAGYKIYFGLTSGGPYPTEVDIPSYLTTTHDIVGLATGTYYFVATAYNTSAVESDYSNEASKVVLPVAPMPPGFLTVTDMVVFTSVKIKDGYRLIAVGTVPANTSCDSSQSVNGHYVVPANAVQWSATVRDVVVVAKCS